MHPHMYQHHATGHGVLNFAVIAVDWADVDTPTEVSARVMRPHAPTCTLMWPYVPTAMTTSNALTPSVNTYLRT